MADVDYFHKSNYLLNQLNQFINVDARIAPTILDRPFPVIDLSVVINFTVELSHEYVIFKANAHFE